MIRTKSTNGTPQASVLDSIGIVLLFDLTLGFESQTLPVSPLIGS